ncbi:MAG TPA: hydroxymethylpyrimidine/phosphomethylpyrimidine kinase [Puia sp.]|jgi:hydroxymethylpyrimidine/phosphomethylpyrimidine kinase|nr:hydroxymethylpyrimidine/phosphomethylpyrimidine kinase [Puia sp.]
MDRPKVLVIAGYDQSAGAGVLSDIKTLEAHGVYGYAAVTGMTFQNERVIRRVEWLALKDVYDQIDVCCETVAFPWVKIGITQSMGEAGEIIDHLRRRHPGVRVVFDPVIRASSGEVFWKELTDEWEALAARCYLITPNWEEIGWLYPGEDIQARCAELSSRPGCHIYLKGGHNREFPGRDYLWSDGDVEVLDALAGDYTPKHGSGCVLSSALTANLALGYPLPIAAERAKRYIERYLSSNKTLLGWH